MPFKIIRNDITRVKADAIVNTANIHPVVGGGTDTAIYNAAGKEKLFAARELIGDIEPGQARETAAYNLNAKFIIHTVCVPWNGGNSNELNILADCYRNSLKLALELNCKSIAFPLIGTGVFGIPYDKALNIANININMPIRTILEEGIIDEKVCGVVINPFGDFMPLPKDILKIILDIKEGK